MSNLGLRLRFVNENVIELIISIVEPVQRVGWHEVGNYISPHLVFTAAYFMSFPLELPMVTSPNLK